MIKIDGTQIAFNIKNDIKEQIETNLILNHRPVPKLVVVMVGDNPASEVYVAGKVKACSQVGIESQVYKMPFETTEGEVVTLIEKLNKDKTVNGILLQLPVPQHIDGQKIIDMICPEKDVDGLTKINLGKLISGDKTGLYGCTPSGIIELLKAYNIDLVGKDVVVINRSLLVGKPLAVMFTNESSTVTICHSKTKDLSNKIKQADIVVVAVGKKNFLTADMIKEDAIVIDVGINRDDNSKKICGDVNFEDVSKKAKLITPVPGGVGPMTIAMLLKNTYLTTIRQYKK